MKKRGLISRASFKDTQLWFSLVIQPKLRDRVGGAGGDRRGGGRWRSGRRRAGGLRNQGVKFIFHQEIDNRVAVNLAPGGQADARGVVPGRRGLATAIIAGWRGTLDTRRAACGVFANLRRSKNRPSADDRPGGGGSFQRPLDFVNPG